MSYAAARIHALEELCCSHALELSNLRREYAETLKRHGAFCEAITRAAFSHSDALTHEQIIDSLVQLRRTAQSVETTYTPKEG